MYCADCGVSLAAESKFCNGCGSQVPLPGSGPGDLEIQGSTSVTKKVIMAVSAVVVLLTLIIGNSLLFGNSAPALPGDWSGGCTDDAIVLTRDGTFKTDDTRGMYSVIEGGYLRFQGETQYFDFKYELVGNDLLISPDEDMCALEPTASPTPDRASKELTGYWAGSSECEGPVDAEIVFEDDGRVVADTVSGTYSLIGNNRLKFELSEGTLVYDFSVSSDKQSLDLTLFDRPERRCTFRRSVDG